MEDDSSTPNEESSPQSSVHSDPPVAKAFTLTKEDIEALQEYVDEFEEADSDRRSTIIANAMADIVKGRPADEPFNKVDASKVNLQFLSTSDALQCFYRKSENGFTTIIPDLSDSM